METNKSIDNLKFLTIPFFIKLYPLKKINFFLGGTYNFFQKGFNQLDKNAKKVERKRLNESDLKGALENDSLSDEEKKRLEFDIQKQEESIIRRLEDYQIAYALDILKSLSIFQENEDL